MAATSTCDCNCCEGDDREKPTHEQIAELEETKRDIERRLIELRGS